MKIITFILIISFIAFAHAAVLLDLDNDGRADAVLLDRPALVDWNRDGVFDWRDDWAVRPGWRGAWDWNGDGIIDWRDDWAANGARPWNGDWIRADWNRDGVLDWQDGWRQLDNYWAGGSWDPAWRGEGWRPETVSVREVPAYGNWQDTDWRSVEGPWDTFGWGGSWVADWNRDGVIDWKDDWAWREGLTGFRSGPELVNVREVPSGFVGAAPVTQRVAAPVTQRVAAPVTQRAAAPAARTATTTTTKPAATTTKPKTSA
jgi:hypothetical protein